MFSKKIFLVLLVTATFCAGISRADTSATANVTNITMMGGLWGNGNKGGFYFMTTSLPSGVNYFIVRPTDLAVKSLLSTIIAAKSAGMKVQVTFNKLTNGEGEVVAISLP